MNRLFLITGLLAVLLAGCRRHKPQTAMPPLRVGVAEAVTDSVPNRMEFIGYLASNFDAVIQPRVNGYLLTKQFANGMPVKRGQLLFTIDPDQLSTSMLAAEAALQSARAQAIEARNNYDRAVPLARINAISQSQLDQYTAQYKAAEATVRSAEQTLSSARMNVGYTELRSPIDGIISNTSAHVGDYVGPGTQFGVLTTISNIDTLTVDVAIPMAQYLRSAGPRTSIFDNAGLLTDIRLMLADGTEYPYEGLYDYTRKDVSSTTGTLVLVVMFPNPDRSLKPGQFARVEASVGPVRPRVVVPQACVSQAQGVNSVLGGTPRQHGHVPPGDPGRHVRVDVVHRRRAHRRGTGGNGRAAETAQRHEGHPRKKVTPWRNFSFRARSSPCRWPSSSSSWG